jgi:predicted DNA-binding transcriptional regulator AlpA
MPTVQKTKARRRQRKISPRFMSREEFANILAVDVRTILRNEKRKTDKRWPTPVRIGSKIILYDRTDVESFLQQSKRSAGVAK